MSSTDPERGALRKFGLVFAVIMLLVALVSLWRGRAGLVVPFFAVSGLFVLVSLVYPVLLSPLYFLMLKLSGYMGWFNTRVILIIVYYLVFTPMALLFKLFGKDPLARRFDRDATTYWHRRDTELDEKAGEGQTDREKSRAFHYEKQF